MLLPLFPLPDVVLFPDTLLPLHIFEPRYRRLVADLLERPAAERRIGMILSTRSAAGGMELVEPGCAGRLIACETLPDGRSNIVLAGEARFTVTREIAGKPYRQVMTETLTERVPSSACERAATIHRELYELVAALVASAGERSSLDLVQLAGLRAPERLAALVNRVATQLDVPPLRKQTLLVEPPLERAEQVAGILRSRIQLLRTLAPYRHLAHQPERN